MKEESTLLFDSFRLDLANASLRRGKRAIFLTPKAFAMLCYLVKHAGQLVTKDDLWQAVWPGVTVTDAALTVCMSEIRKTLGDNVKTPKFIETVHRRGYRFIGAVRSSESGVKTLNQPLASNTWPPKLVGRETELTQLHRLLEKALSGERQIIFVTGEAGIGKTTLVEAFLRQVAADGSLWIGRGQCIEHYGAGEAYLPVLAALGQLGQEPGGERLIALLDRYAPTWLAQMPALLSAAALEALQRRTAGATRERMLREMAEAVEALTAERPLVLALEDLHWSDYATLDLLSFLARRRQPARLLVLGTYRPVEVLVREHPLKAVEQELHLHKQCEELALGFLTENNVAQYLAVRLPASRLPAELARAIHRRTDGNPLFMVNVVDNILTRGVVEQTEGWWEIQAAIEAVEVGVPESIHQLIEQQFDRLSPEDQHMLDVASAAGAEFSAAAVAAGVEAEMSEIEARCVGLARQALFLRASGTEEWPDGTVAARYSFLHALYQEVVYERVTAGRRVRLHQRIGERKEAAYGERAGEIAAELAVHFARGHGYRRAVQYYEQAGKNALQRSAHVEAISLLTKGLDLLKTLPDTPERTQQELTLRLALGPALIATRGNAASEVGQTYTRARELCQQVGETSQIFPVLFGLRSFHLVQGEVQTAHELGEQLLSLAQRAHDTDLLLEAHLALGNTSFIRGEFILARAHFEQSLALYDPQQHRSHAFLYGLDPGVFCLSRLTWTLWSLGYPDQALETVRAALTLAQKVSHAYSLVFAVLHAAWTHFLRREGRTVQERGEAAKALCIEQGFPHLLGGATLCCGWALVVQGEIDRGIAQIQEGLASCRATGASLLMSFYPALLAEACGKAEQCEMGLSVVAEALAVVQQNGEHLYEAELYRLKGELTLKQFGVRSQGKSRQVKASQNKSEVTSLQAEAEAEVCFLKAIEIARHQQAKSLELRAVMSLSRLWQQQDKKKEAHQMLSEIYGWFTEGFHTADLQEARALLEELSR